MHDDVRWSWFGLQSAYRPHLAYCRNYTAIKLRLRSASPFSYLEEAERLRIWREAIAPRCIVAVEP